MEQRLAVIDLGSNSFRLVVFTYTDDWWKRTDEIYEPVRVGEHQETGGPLQPEPMERALETIELFAHFCRATGIERVRPLATSAIREASNRKAFVRAASERSGLDVEVLSREQEARYGYLAVVNSTTLTDGVALDIGGGSMQLTRVEDRHARDARSWRLGAVVTTERFLAAERVKPKHLKALREHVHDELAEAPWLRDAPGRLAGIGGTVRNLAAAVMLERGLPSYGVQGFCLERDALDALVERLAELTPAERRRVPGIKPERGDLILAGAVVVQTVMEAGGFDGARGDRGRAARGRVLRGAARRTATRRCCPTCARRRCTTSPRSTTPTPRTRRTSRGSRSRSGTRWPRPACTPATSEERELLWAAAMLHDVGTAVDYDDHHKHSRYLILNAGLPGYSPRETALIGQAARYHRKGQPGPRRVRAARAQGRRGAARPLLRGAAAGGAARAPARPDRPPRARRGAGRPRRAAAAEPTPT